MTKYYINPVHITTLQYSSSTTLGQFNQVNNDTALVDHLATSFKTITTDSNACCISNQKLAASYDSSYFLNSFKMYAGADLGARFTDPKPLSLKYFRQLPSVFGFSTELLTKYHLVYVLILDKPGKKSLVCIGSASNTSDGAYSRVREHTTSQCG